MSAVRAWPYAATAIVQHDWSANVLSVWVIFRHPMDQDVKPAHGLWLCEVDSVLKAITVSAWQDEWTILLTVPNVLALPGEVTLEYDGPDENLQTTWSKQWEPWGPILSTGILAAASIVTAAINPNTALDVDLFEDLTIANTADGQMIQIWRNAAEGKDSVQIYVDQSRLPTINSTTPGGYIYFRSLGNTKLVVRTDYVELRQGTWLRIDGNGTQGVFGLGAGTAGDARIWYDGVNMHINPQAIGTGFLILDNCPAADPHVVGGIWNNGGVLTISAG